MVVPITYSYTDTIETFDLLEGPNSSKKKLAEGLGISIGPFSSRLKKKLP